MRVQMKKDGTIVIIAESDVETYALDKWLEENDTMEAKAGKMLFITVAETE